MCIDHTPENAIAVMRSQRLAILMYYWRHQIQNLVLGYSLARHMPMAKLLTVDIAEWRH